MSLARAGSRIVDPLAGASAPQASTMLPSASTMIETGSPLSSPAVARPKSMPITKNSGSGPAPKIAIVNTFW